MICELSDLPEEQCACRIHGPKEDPFAEFPEYGRFATRVQYCNACGTKIEKGEPISLMGRLVVHTDCWTLF
jgi:hypothetical protein